jgi:hypothetical protein
MAKRVFILGAGASVHAGTPLMNNFLDKARDLQPRLRDRRYIDAAKLVFKAISSLQQVHSKSELDLFNLESLFTTFEMAATIGQLADLEEHEIAKLVEALRTVIVFTLDYSMSFPVSRTEGFIASAAYRLLSDKIYNFLQAHSSVAIITFNYDVAVELALHYTGRQFSYCLDGSQPQQDVIPLLKLHGSINWGATGSAPNAPIVECPIAWLDNAEYCQDCLMRSIEPHSQSFSLNVGSRFFDYLRRSGHNDVREAPVIVPPGMYKTEYQNSLARVWKAAAHELANAEYIYVAGYSLPATDFFFHNLYALGTVSPTILRRFSVIDTNPKIEGRFKSLLGPGARDRFQEPYLRGFEDAMQGTEMNPKFWE